MLIATSQIADLKNNNDRSHFQKVFSLALGINDPWCIKSQGMVPCAKSPDILEMRVEVDFKDGNRFSYNGSEELYPVHDTRERTWRHLNFFQYRCYIHTRVSRIILPEGEVKTVDVPRVRDLSIFILTT